MIAFVHSPVHRLSFWIGRARTRRQLRDLDAHLLHDIGLAAIERDAECARWGWQGADVPIEQVHAKENGRCLRAPVQIRAF